MRSNYNAPHPNKDYFSESKPMTIRLLLISHAATPAMRGGRFPGDALYDAADLDSAASHAALTALRERLGASADVFALSSPAACARDTATALGLAAQIDAALADMDYGRWRGRRLAEFGEEEAADVGRWSVDPAVAPHGGESFEAVLVRVAAWLEGLAALHGKQDRRGVATLVAVTHAPVIRAALLHALNAPAASFSRIEVAPLSVVELRRGFGRRDWQLWTAM